MLGWKKHKLESRLPGEISITSDMQMTAPIWQKVHNIILGPSSDPLNMFRGNRLAWPGYCKLPIKGVAGTKAQRFLIQVSDSMRKERVRLAQFAGLGLGFLYSG